MLKQINTILSFYKLNTKETLVYRGMILLWALGWIFSFVAMVFMWQSTDTSLFAGDYDTKHLITYYFLGILVWAICGWFPFYYILELIKNGTIVKFIFRPIDVFWAMFGIELGWHTVSAVIYFLLLMGIYIFFKDSLILDLSPARLILFLLSMISTSLLIFEFSMILGTIAFWLTNAEGLGALFWMVLAIFGGRMVPIAFFPSFWQKVVYILPFRFMHSFPIEIYLGKINTYSTAVSFLIATAWIIFFYFLFRYLWKKGLKSYTAFGQ